MRLGTVYAIRNTVNERQYIGQTTRGARTRWCGHRHALTYGHHTTPMLQADWDAMGIGAFEIIVLESHISPARLPEREWFWVMATVAAGVEIYNQIARGTCPVDGTVFETWGKGVYCSTECRVKDWRAKKKRQQ